MWLRILNRKHAAARERVGKAANVVDFSMEHKTALPSYDEAVTETPRTGSVGDKAFEDVPDLRNEDFIYVY